MAYFTVDFAMRPHRRQPSPSIFHRIRRLGGYLSVLAWFFVAAKTGSALNTNTVYVYRCDFGEEWDIDYDGWPDRWVRNSGPENPHYVSIGIQEDSEVEGGHCLRVDLDGAAASIQSAPIRVISRFSYSLTAKLKNEELKHSTAYLTFDLCNSAGQVVQSVRSDSFSTTNGWIRVHIPPVEPRDASTDHAVIGLHVVRGLRGDLKGRVSLTDLRVFREPRIDVTTNNPCNVYIDRNDVAIECALSGIREQRPMIEFRLLDGTNKELQHEELPLEGRLIENLAGKRKGSTNAEEPEGYEGVLKWRPKIPDYGFYRVVIRMKGTEAGAEAGTAAKENPKANAQESLADRQVDIVVVPPLPMPEEGEFGWSIPNGNEPLSLSVLSKLLPKVGINWAKVPVCYDTSKGDNGDEMMRFIEMLSASNIDVVGVVTRQADKASAGKKGQVSRELSMGDVLSQDYTAWSTALEPVITRLALRVRWWQLGRDYDATLFGMPELNERVEELRTALFRFGQDVHIGFCGDWDAEETYPGDVKWDFVQLAMQSYPTDKELESLLAKPRQNSALRWIVIDPPYVADFQPPPSELDAAVCSPTIPHLAGAAFLVPAWILSEMDMPRKAEATRIARSSAFVHRLVNAKLSGADGIMIAKPFNDENGLMQANGFPAELLLPFRTTAAMISGAKYLGRMRLPNKSPNHVFLRPDGQVVMMLWNQEPTKEVLYLGENVQQVDLLGRATAAPRRRREQVLQAGPTPIFVLGLHEAITRWRMNVAFETNQVPSIFSRPHHNALAIKNYFPQGVGGTVKIVVLQEQEMNGLTGRPDPASFALDRWIIEPPSATFQLAAGAGTQFPFDIKLKSALYGAQPIRVDFTIEADERLEFSVYDEMNVGTDDITLDVRSRLDKDGNLVVDQRMINHTNRLADFKCNLRCRGLRPQRMQVYRLGQDMDLKVYRFQHGEELLGKEMMLDIEEVNGQRVIKYRFVAGKNPRSEKKPRADQRGLADKDEKEKESKVPRPLARIGS